MSATQARKTGQFDQAIRLFESALRQAERFGEKDPRLTTSLRDLADLYLHTKNYSKAEPLYLRELKILEAFGKNYPDVAHDLYSLGRIYSKQYDYAKAATFFRQAVVIEEKFPQANAAELYNLYSDLAENCKNLKNYSDAAVFYKKMLASRQVYAPGRPQLTEDLELVAENYENLGKYEEAATYYQRAAAQLEKTYGVSAGSVTAMCQLANVRLRQTNFAQADKLADQICKQVINIHGKQTGILNTHLTDLASHFANSGQHSQAERVYKAALSITGKDTSVGQIDTARTLLALAELYTNDQRQAEAVACYQKVCAIYERILGRKSIPYIHAISWLGSARVAQRRYAEAKALFHQALFAAERLPTANYPELINALRCLASVSLAEKKYSESEALFKRALNIAQKNTDSNSCVTADCLHDLGLVYLYQQKRSQVLPLYERAAAIYSSQPDPDTVNVSLLASTLSTLSSMYLSTNNYAAAEPLCKKAIDLYKNYPTHRERYFESLSTYEDLLRRTNRSSQADQVAAEVKSAKTAYAATTYTRLAPLLNKKRAGDEALGLRVYLELGKACILQNKIGEARDLSKKLQALVLDYHGKVSPELAMVLTELGLQFTAIGKYADAEELYKAALSAKGRPAALGKLGTAETCVHLADLCAQLQRLPEAETNYRRAMNIYEETAGRNSVEVCHCLTWLGQTILGQNRAAEAMPLFRRSLAIAEKLPEKNGLEVAGALRCIAAVLRSEKNFSESEALGRRALDICQKAGGTKLSATGDCLHDLGLLYFAQEKYDQALSFFNQALAVYSSQESSSSANSPGVAEIYTDFAMIKLAQKNYPQAEANCKKAIELWAKSPGNRSNYLGALHLYEILLRRTNRITLADHVAAQSKLLRETTK